LLSRSFQGARASRMFPGSSGASHNLGDGERSIQTLLRKVLLRKVFFLEGNTATAAQRRGALELRKEGRFGGPNLKNIEAEFLGSKLSLRPRKRSLDASTHPENEKRRGTKAREARTAKPCLSEPRPLALRNAPRCETIVVCARPGTRRDGRRPQWMMQACC